MSAAYRSSQIGRGRRTIGGQGIQAKCFHTVSPTGGANFQCPCRNRRTRTFLPPHPLRLSKPRSTSDWVIIKWLSEWSDSWLTHQRFLRMHAGLSWSGRDSISIDRAYQYWRLQWPPQSEGHHTKCLGPSFSTRSLVRDDLNISKQMLRTTQSSSLARSPFSMEHHWKQSLAQRWIVLSENLQPNVSFEAISKVQFLLKETKLISSSK